MEKRAMNTQGAMYFTQNTIIFCNLSPSHLLLNKNNERNSHVTFSKNNSSSHNSPPSAKPASSISFVSTTFLAQSVVAVLGLGFVDAGYSGDWSRIGVISKEIEGLLKIAAFVVVPLCIYFVISFSEKTEN